MDLLDSLPEPDWVDSGSVPTTGVDLLGLRQPAQVISNTLLNGITTISPSVRYLSFRSWIAHHYVQAKLPQNWAHFWEFAASVETAIAYANLLENPNGVGVLGRREGKKIIANSGRNLPLNALVKQLAVTAYAGPSDQLLLSFHNESGIPGLSKERGRKLVAIVHKQLIQSDLGRKFARGAKLKQASRSQLAEWASHVSVFGIPEEEREFLTQIIIPEQPRKAELPRVATYAALLHLALHEQKPPSENALLFASIQRDSTLPSELHATLDGWLRYCVRDLLDVVHEVVLQQVTETVEHLGPGIGEYVDANEVIQYLVNKTQDHIAILTELKILRSGEKPPSISFNEFHNRIQRTTRRGRWQSGDLVRWRGGLDELSIINLASEARKNGTCIISLVPVSWVLALNRTNVKLDVAGGDEDLLSYQGWARIGLRQVIYPMVEKFLNEAWSLEQVMVELTGRTIDQHLRIAWARLAQDPMKDVAVLNTDGDRWAYRTHFYPLRTASRLKQAIGWLSQLRLIDETGLTADGKAVLQSAIRSLKNGDPDESA